MDGYTDVEDVDMSMFILHERIWERESFIFAPNVTKFGFLTLSRRGKTTGIRA